MKLVILIGSCYLWMVGYVACFSLLDIDRARFSRYTRVAYGLIPIWGIHEVYMLTFSTSPRLHIVVQEINFCSQAS
jgi:hypothetical protein